MKKTILVTGSHRSGSTWTGTVISQSKKVRYVQEPFNLAIKKYNSPIKYWFEHVNLLDEKSYQNKIKKYLNSFLVPFVLNGKQKRKHKSYPKFIYSHLLEAYRKSFKRTLIKDPIAIMSAEWIYKTYPTDVVILIRHPAAFIASLKLKNWEFDFNNFLDQPNLMNTYLKPFDNDIRIYAREKQPILNQGILLWNILYSVVIQYRKKHGDNWYFVKHEDLSLNPEKEFKALFKFLKLSFHKDIQNYLSKTTTSENNTKLKRDSKLNIYTWKNRLSEEEIQQIKHRTSNVWKHFYSEKDW